MGAAVLSVVGVLAVGLAVHGAHQPGLGLTGSTGPAGAPGTIATGPSPTPPPTSRPSAPARPAPRSAHPTATPRPTTPSPGATATPAVKLGPALASSQYAPYAFKIYPGTPTAQAQQALAGFRTSVRRSGQALDLTIDVLGSGQAPVHQTYTAGDTIYFVEANLGDDTGSSEFNFGDDGVIATNPKGRIIE